MSWLFIFPLQIVFILWEDESKTTDLDLLACLVFSDYNTSDPGTTRQLFRMEDVKIMPKKKKTPGDDDDDDDYYLPNPKSAPNAHQIVQNFP